MDSCECGGSFLEVCRPEVEGLLNVEAAELQSLYHGQETRKSAFESRKRLCQDRPRKASKAKVALASV